MQRVRHGGEASFLERLFTSVLGTFGIEDVLCLTGSFYGVGLALFIPAEGRVIVESQNRDFAERCRFYPLAEILRLYRHWPVGRGGCECYLVADGNEKNGRIDDVVPHLANAIALCMKPETSRDDEGKLLARLVAADDDDLTALTAALRRNGIPPDSVFFVAAVSVRHRVASCHLPDGFIDSFSGRCQKILMGSPVRAIGGQMEGCFAAAFFCGDEGDVTFVLKNMESAARHLAYDESGIEGLSIRIGIGERGNNIGDYGRSFREAVIAIRHSAIDGSEKLISHWRGLGVQQLLAAPARGGERGSAPLYAPLSELRILQNKGGAPLFSTLIALVADNWNITQTASRLCLHYNSMKYRYDRIGEALSADLNDPQRRFELSMLVRAYLYTLPHEDFYDLIAAQ